MEKYGIEIDLERDQKLSEHAVKLLRDFYMLPEENSVQETYARASKAWSGGDKELAQRLYDAVSKNWFVYASPILSNAPIPGERAKGLPISCYLNYVDDSLESLIAHTEETRWLSVKGGGVGGHWSAVRAVSDIAPGPIPFIHTIDADMIAYRQGKTRKGSYAAYMDISHPDIVEFVNIRVPTGDANRKCLNLNHGINITDDFMSAVLENKIWNLVDPKTKEIRSSIKARELWEQILETRYRTGEPYLCFIDTANKALPQPLKDKGLKINGSNLCTEIFLASSPDRTAVCCLSSLNLEYYDEWKDTNLIADLVTMLDNVLDNFIKTAPEMLAKARYSAYRERSIGLGAMGYHSYLQRNNIPFESIQAKLKNQFMFKDIKAKALAESKRLAILRGDAPDMEGTGLRHAHLLAVAPNANSAIIADTSPSIEPWHANAFVHRTRAGSYLVKNKYLQQVLSEMDKDNESIWSSIISNNGSVQELDFLDQKTKDVFKTAMELDQEVIIEHASDRQVYLCQGQSINLFFPSKIDRTLVNNVHINAWKLGLKSLYYLRTETSSKAESVGKLVIRQELPMDTSTECVACAV